jgi:hypothetical protein
MKHPAKPTAAEPERWLDRAENVRKVYYSVWIACALLLVAELFIDKHVELEMEHLFGFHGFYGLVACVALVLAAKALRRVLKRPESYYDDR